MKHLLWAVLAAALVVPVPGAEAQTANPRLRAELLASPKRVILRDRACRGDVEDPSRSPGIRARIVSLAAREWEAFRFSTLDIASRGLPAIPVIGTAAGTPRQLVPESLNPVGEGFSRRLLRVGTGEDARSVALRIAGYWAVVPEQSAVETQNQLWRIWADTGWAQPWSAAFVSWVMCETGLSESAFRRSAQHAGYVAQAFAGGGAAFEPRPVTERAVPGDLLCAGRAAAADIASLDEARRLAQAGAAMHCDIVVGTAPDRLYAIGGNVENSVSLTVVPLRAGRVVPNEHRRWFGILRLKAPPERSAALANVSFACVGRADLRACLDEL